MQITHMDWGEECSISPSGGGQPITFVCTPAQHNSGRSWLALGVNDIINRGIAAKKSLGRGINDQGTTLWASWIASQTLQERKVSVYHAGDTGYMTESGPSPCFAEIGEKYGPFDLAMIPIWRGGSLSFIAAAGLRLVNRELLDGLHASPAHAVMLHKDVRAKHSLAMHFATFAGSDDEALEPLIELVAAREEAGVGDWREEGGFGWLDVGGTATVPISEATEN
jgi:N-acyl-phosphatidylethanolamine-hydrolysing phospholipase D